MLKQTVGAHRDAKQLHAVLEGSQMMGNDFCLTLRKNAEKILIAR